ncbi:hypothetical protein N8515_01435 [bacterium]|jgi:hypothetical protein|nr:hypothetical protein [bacterium]MDB4627572.1 hypothetical protein [Akkermansiaceae bacterium]MDB4785013.1 hypothetical protein [Akkermansiaceae bacterium]
MKISLEFISMGGLPLCFTRGEINLSERPCPAKLVEALESVGACVNIPNQ